MIGTFWQRAVALANAAGDKVVGVFTDQFGVHRLEVRALLDATPSPGAAPTAYTKLFRRADVLEFPLTSGVWTKIYNRGTLVAPQKGRVDSIHLEVNNSPYSVRILVDSAANNIMNDLSTDRLGVFNLSAGNSDDDIAKITNGAAASNSIRIKFRDGIIYTTFFEVWILTGGSNKRANMMIYQNED